MNGLTIAIIVGIPAAFLAAGAAIGRLERRFRREQRQATDWPESSWPSVGGWADRERL